MKETKVCNNCDKAYPLSQFYADRLGIHMDVCKGCATEDIDVHNPFNTPDLFEYLNIPIISKEWHNLLIKYKNPFGDIEPKAIFGRYLSKMKLMSFRGYRYKDTEEINQIYKKVKLQDSHVKGIVWGKTNKSAQDYLSEIVQSYLDRDIEISFQTRDRVQFENGDHWLAVRADDNARGHCCNISYIDDSISIEIIDCIIKPCTKAGPYKVFNYYRGEREDEGYRDRFNF